MDVTHCNIGPPMGKFWMLPIITSASESVKMGGETADKINTQLKGRAANCTAIEG